MSARKTIAYSYIRFSSKRQEHGDSLKRQREDRQRWLDRHPDVVLDDEIDLEDLGLSGYFGKNLDPETGKLGQFIELCKDGKIQENSYLLLEHLDRFSRGDAIDVAKVFKDLVVKHGLRIVALSPSEQEINRQNVGNTETVISIVLGFQMAHIYSKNLSKRIRSSWRTRKQKAREGVKLKTTNIPAWLDQDKDGGFSVNPEKIKPIDFIFSKISEGMSQRKIVQELNKSFDPITKATYWNPSYVCRLLNDRRLLGEFQPQKKTIEGKFVADGEPIKDYFPKIIHPDIFYSAQSAKTKHKRLKTNKRTGETRNLFTGLLRCSDGFGMFLAKHRYTNRVGKTYESIRLSSYGKKIGKESANGVSLKYEDFEDLMMVALSELTPKDIKDNSEKSKELSKILEIISGLKQKIQIVDKRIEDDSVSVEDFEAGLRLKKELEMNLRFRKDEYDSLVGTEELPKKKILMELKDIVRRDYKHDNAVRKRYANLIAQIIDRIEIEPFKINARKSGAFGRVVLRSGKSRLFVLCNDQKIKRTICFYKNEKYFVATNKGLIVFEGYTDRATQKNLQPLKLQLKTDYSGRDVFNGIAKDLHFYWGTAYEYCKNERNRDLINDLIGCSVDFIAAQSLEQLD